MVQLGRYAPPTHTIAHLSDPHFLGGRRALYGAVDTDAELGRALQHLVDSGRRPDAIVITGDLTDLGEPDAYERLRDAVEPVAARLGAELVWVMGNHDERAPFASVLQRRSGSDGPQDRVHDLAGLRLVALDTSVPGFHHGDLTAAQLDWLAGVLAEPAEHGTLLALHHPPLPSPVELMAVLELHGQDELAEVLRGSDVRAILAGHLHHGTYGTFAGIPVSVAGATCYTIQAAAPVGEIRGLGGARTWNLVEVRPDVITHSAVPVDEPPRVSGFSGAVLDRLATMTPAERRAAFSDKRSTFNVENP